jgi:hypothetical protein
MMNDDDATRRRNKLEADAHAKMQESLNQMRDELSKTNERVSQQLQEKEEMVEEEETESPSPAPAVEKKRKASSSSLVTKPLIYFSYPMSNYTEQPVWVNPLRQVLIQNGYLVYNPWDKVGEQFGQQDLPLLNALPLRVVKSLCSLLYIPEEVLLPFEAIWKIIQQGDSGDNYGIVFQCLWLLTRSSLVVCDLMRPMAGAGTAQELLYSRQLGIPVVGLLPTSGQLNPFTHRSTTVLFSGADLLSLLPVIKGYAPAN